VSYKSPILPVLTLKGLDSKVQDIQILMHTSLSWLDKSFGLADRIVEMRDEKSYIFPATFESNTKDPIPLTPSDAWNSFSFWVKSGDTEFDKINPQDPLITCPVSCIFYLDIHKIDPSASYKETKSKLIEDIFHFFNTVHFNGILTAKKFIEDDLTEVYKGFTIDQLDNKFKMYPKWTCRMDFELSYRDDCYSLNTYGTLSIPDNALINEDGVPILNEDGSYIYTS
jgi:hypothetical protein